jgi:hypothetical protein
MRIEPTIRTALNTAKGRSQQTLAFWPQPDGLWFRVTEQTTTSVRRPVDDDVLL